MGCAVVAVMLALLTLYYHFRLPVVGAIEAA